MWLTETLLENVVGVTILRYNTEDKILFKNAIDENLSNVYICFVNHLVSTNNSYAYSHQVAHGICRFPGFPE